MSTQLLYFSLVDCSDERIAGLLPRRGAHHCIGADIESRGVSGTVFDGPTFAEQPSCVSWRPYNLNAVWVGQLDDDAISPDVGHGIFSAFDAALTTHACLGSYPAASRAEERA